MTTSISRSTQQTVTTTITVIVIVLFTTSVMPPGGMRKVYTFREENKFRCIFGEDLCVEGHTKRKCNIPV